MKNKFLCIAVVALLAMSTVAAQDKGAAPAETLAGRAYERPAPAQPEIHGCLQEPVLPARTFAGW